MHYRGHDAAFMFYVLCDNVFISLLMCVCHSIIKGFLLTYLLRDRLLSARRSTMAEPCQRRLRLAMHNDRVRGQISNISTACRVMSSQWNLVLTQLYLWWPTRCVYTVRLVRMARPVTWFAWCQQLVGRNTQSGIHTNGGGREFCRSSDFRLAIFAPAYTFSLTIHKYGRDEFYLCWRRR